MPVPVLFQRAGYYTCIGGPLGGKKIALGKTDYNFEWDPAMYDGTDWSGRKPGQPFFMQVQLHGGKHRGNDVVAGDNWERRVRRELGEPTQRGRRHAAALLSARPGDSGRLGPLSRRGSATPTRKSAT